MAQLTLEEFFKHGNFSLEKQANRNRPYAVA